MPRFLRTYFIAVTGGEGHGHVRLYVSFGIYALYKVKLSKKLVKKAGSCYNINVCKLIGTNICDKRGTAQ